MEQSRDLAALLQDIPKGWWVAIARSEDRVIAKAADLNEAISKARATGESNPYVIRVPEKDLPVFFHQA